LIYRVNYDPDIYGAISEPNDFDAGWKATVTDDTGTVINLTDQSIYDVVKIQQLRQVKLKFYP
tara:strand:+ start:30 stop:218 length:189 start_codon:yes stop_codon:yes gene_type:complete